MERIPGKRVWLRRRLVLGLATACVLLGALPALASAATIQVNTQDDPAGPGCPSDCSIRRAIDAASDGDTVAIPAGHYLLDSREGTLFVGKNLTIQGTGNPVMDGGGAIGVFSIGGNGSPFPFALSKEVTVDGGTGPGGGRGDKGGGGVVGVGPPGP